MEQELQKQAESILGYIMYFLLSGVVLILVKSTLESIVESIKVFWGKDLNTDDVVVLNGRPARVVRVGMWKTTFFAYEIGTANGELKDQIIEKPLQMLDLSKWKDK
jgi:hypothetical protein